MNKKMLFIIPAALLCFNQEIKPVSISVSEAFAIATLSAATSSAITYALLRENTESYIAEIEALWSINIAQVTNTLELYKYQAHSRYGFVAALAHMNANTKHTIQHLVHKLSYRFPLFIFRDETIKLAYKKAIVLEMLANYADFIRAFYNPHHAKMSVNTIIAYGTSIYSWVDTISSLSRMIDKDIAELLSIRKSFMDPILIDQFINHLQDINYHIKSSPEYTAEQENFSPHAV